MKIPLNEFEQYIDEKILKRGLSYFKGGSIADFLEISTGEYEAIVSGTEEYTVGLRVSKNIITKHNCDCPYDMGPVCKHIVAVIFLLQHELGLKSPNNTRKIKKKKTKSISLQVKELLKTISHKELVEFVYENSKQDRIFRNYFLVSFSHLNQEQSKESYKKQIHSILQAAKGRDGWIDWSGMKQVVRAIEPFLENAKKYLTNGDFKNVFYISATLLEKMTEALECSEDSNGDLYYFAESATELLITLTKEKLPETLRQEIFNYCISSFNKKLFKDWDWHFEIFDIIDGLIEKESDADIIINCLDTIKGDYRREKAQSRKLDLLRRFKKSKEEVETYLNKNISNSLIRKQEIEKAFIAKDFKRVIKLSEDGIKYNKKNEPGLVIIWYNWLLKVAQIQKNALKIIEYARLLFIHDFHVEQDYYQILKENIEEQKWHPFLENLIKELTLKNGSVELIRKIYIKEEWWDRLFLMVKQCCSLESIQHNEHYLSKDYSSELIELYSKSIVSYMDKFVGRNHYQTACRYLRRMKKLGGEDKVDELIKLFQKQYPKRSALIDELNRV